jgi:ribosomal protein L11 methyltransferase
MVEASPAGHAIEGGGTDRALCVTIPARSAEAVGAVLMALLGPFEQKPDSDDPGGTVTLIFYPGPEAKVTREDIVAALPPGLGPRDAGSLRVETRAVSRDWVEGWRDHFHPVVIGAVRIRPPWESEDDLPAGFVDVVINPGLGFGTGLHPTTRGVLRLLQEEGGKRVAPVGGRSVRHSRGPLVDAGTGSGVLAIAAAKLGWAPILAFDNDPMALISARANIEANGVRDMVQVYETEVAEASTGWFEGATVLANITLDPVSALLARLGGSARVLVSGILAGAQERELLRTAGESGFLPGGRVYEDEWVSLEFLPMPAAVGGELSPDCSAAGAGLPVKRAGG